MELCYETCKNIVNQKLQDLLTLSYFLKIILEKAQNFTSINSIYGMVFQGRYYSRSKKGREKLRHVSGQSETAGL